MTWSQGQDILSEFRQSAERYGSKTAFWQKRLGLWTATSWTEYSERVDAVAARLLRLAPDADYSRTIVVLCTPRSEWPIIELASRAARVTCVPISVQCSTKQIASICLHLKPRAMFFEATGTSSDLFRDAGDIFQTTELVCLDGDDGDISFVEGAQSFDRFVLEGHAHPLSDLGRSDALHRGTIKRVSTPAPSSADNFAIETRDESELLALSRGMSAVRRAGGDEQLASSAIMSSTDFCWTVLRPFYTGASVMFAEGDTPLAEKLLEVTPTSILLTNDEWEYIRSRLTAGVNDATTLGRWLCGSILAADDRGAARPDMFLTKLFRDWLRGRMRVATGLDRASLCLCDEPVPGSLQESFQRLGIKIETLRLNDGHR